MSVWPSASPAEWTGVKGLDGCTWEQLDEVAWTNNQFHSKHRYSMPELGAWVVVLAQISYDLVSRGFAPLGIQRLEIAAR